MDEEDVEETIRWAIAWNDRLKSDAMKKRKRDPEKYPRVLGVDLFTDHVKLNKLHKEH